MISKILLLQPSLGGVRSSDALEPLVFGILKAMTPKHVQLDFADERKEALPPFRDYDWVVMSATSFQARRVYQLAAEAKKQGARTALGGFHASMLPQEAAQYVDVVFVGDAEDTWPEFLKDLEENQVKKRYQSSCAGLEQVKTERSLFLGKGYPPMAVVQLSRGCRYHCEFCSIAAMYPQSRKRDISLVIEEIKNLKQKVLFLADDNLLQERPWLIEFLKAMRPLKKTWTAQISLDVAWDPEVLSLMKAAGCMMLLIGFESLDQKNLSSMGKGANLQRDYDLAIRNIETAGLAIYATFVLGYEEDRAESFQELREFSLKHGFFLANFNPLMALPGTPLYERLEKEERLLYPRWWMDEHFRYGMSMVKPARMSPQELEEGCFRLRKSFYSLGNILRRLFRPINLRHPLIFLMVNLISRREILSKQGRRL